MKFENHEKRSGEDRRSGSSRREVLDFARLGTSSEKRQSIIDRRDGSGRRSSDMITIYELERLR